MRGRRGAGGLGGGDAGMADGTARGFAAGAAAFWPRWGLPSIAGTSFSLAALAMLALAAGSEAALGLLLIAAPVAALAGALLVWQIVTLDVDDPARCLRLFRSNRDFGLIVFAAIVAGQVA